MSGLLEIDDPLKEELAEARKKNSWIFQYLISI